MPPLHLVSPYDWSVELFIFEEQYIQLKAPRASGRLADMLNRFVAS